MGGQGQGRRFDRARGVLILELHRAEIPQRRVQSAGVVDLLDEPGQVGADVLERLVVRQVDRLGRSWALSVVVTKRLRRLGCWSCSPINRRTFLLLTTSPCCRRLRRRGGTRTSRTRRR